MRRVTEEKSRREKSEKRKSQKKEDAGAQTGRKVAIHCVFPMICGSGGSKSRLAKAAGAETFGQMDEKLHAVGFCSMSKNDGRRGRFAEDLQRCMSRGRRHTRDMFIRDVRRLGR